MVALRIDRAWLIEHDACEDAAKAFLAAHPEGAVLTRALLDEVTVRPHLEWLLENLPLTAAALELYEAERAPTLARYKAETAAALAWYDAEIAAAWAWYDAEIAAAWARYDAETAPTLARYEAERAPAWARYEAEIAAALWLAIVASGLAE